MLCQACVGRTLLFPGSFARPMGLGLCLSGVFLPFFSSFFYTYIIYAIIDFIYGGSIEPGRALWELPESLQINVSPTPGTRNEIILQQNL